MEICISTSGNGRDDSDLVIGLEEIGGLEIFLAAGEAGGFGDGREIGESGDKALPEFRDGNGVIHFELSFGAAGGLATLGEEDDFHEAEHGA
jgi:hypothetical protein